MKKVSAVLTTVLMTIAVVGLLAGVPKSTQAGVPDDGSTRTKLGQQMPQFTLRTLDGKEITTASLKGKVVFINFFATWCGPCRAELPHVEKEIWKRFKDNEHFAMLVVGREHSEEELVAFRKETEFTFPIAPDPGRQVYSLFAEKWIPRNYVFDADGSIAFQSASLSTEEFEAMVDQIASKLKAMASSASE